MLNSYRFHNIVVKFNFNNKYNYSTSFNSKILFFAKISYQNLHFFYSYDIEIVLCAKEIELKYLGIDMKGNGILLFDERQEFILAFPSGYNFHFRLDTSFY